MKRITLIICIVFLIVFSGNVNAVTNVTGCGTLNNPGETYVLSNDITNSRIENCITIGADNVTLDGAGYSLSDGFGAAVYLSGRAGVTVKNLKINRFDFGISIIHARDNITLTNLTLNSTFWGIWVYDSNNVTLTDSTLKLGYFGIYVSNSNNTILMGNTVNSSEYDGIRFDSSNNSTITNNTASENSHGFYVDSSTNNTFTNNIASGNGYGFYVDRSTNNTLTGNVMNSNSINFHLTGRQNSHFDNIVDTSNTVDGKPIYYVRNTANMVYDSTNAGIFYCISCDNVTVKNLTLTKNSYGVFFWNTDNSKIENVNASNNHYGILLRSSSYNTLTNINVKWNGNGIHIYYHSNYNTVTSNNVKSNGWGGISLGSSTDNIISNNNANSNGWGGIHIDSSNNNTLANNTASENQISGLYLRSSSNNTIVNNLFNNTINFKYVELTNTWNIPKTIGPNIVGGPYLGGNFWAKPDGTGFSETCTDTDKDGICDLSYTLASGNVDYLPLSPNFTVDTPPLPYITC